MTEVKRIIFRCPEDVFQRLDVEAKRQGVDRTSFIVRALVNACDLAEYQRAYPNALSEYAELAKRVEALEKRS